MIVKLNNAAIIQSNPEAKLLLKSNDFEIIHLTLKIDEVLYKHNNPFEVTFYILQGKGTITINDKSFTLKKDELINVKPNNDRTWKNTGKENLRILILKVKTLAN